jgi:hypothetical protein
MLLGLDEGSSNVVPKSKVTITKKCGHGENNAKAKKNLEIIQKNSLPQSSKSAKSDTLQQRK